MQVNSVAWGVFHWTCADVSSLCGCCNGSEVVSKVIPRVGGVLFRYNPKDVEVCVLCEDVVLSN